LIHRCIEGELAIVSVAVGAGGEFLG
jgi:hypothetical protein